MYRAVREYRLLPGSGAEFLRRVKQDFVPLISQTHAFVSYEVRPDGNDQVTTISTFDTRAAAEEAIFQALCWVQDNCADLIQVPMQHFLNHLMATHRLPISKQEMTCGGPFDYTYLLSCEEAS